ncbi:MAG TPA: multiubiquitin domain-containing protein [Armatimonadota bacterium]|jgi:hypothetical protein
MEDTQQNVTAERVHEKETAIVVNGRRKVVAGKDISFAQVVALAFDPPPTGDNVIFTVTYRNGQGQKPEGTLVDGESVRVKDGMIFDVRATNKS